MMRKMSLGVGVLALFFVAASTAFAYTAHEVQNGGTIEGTVLFTGKTVPVDQTVTVTPQFTKYCGDTLPAERYLIKDRRIQNVVVYIEGIRSGMPAPHESVTLTNRKCAFVPHVAIGYTGTDFIERNDDPIAHNIHTFWGGKTMYNVTLPGGGMSLTKPLRDTGLIEIQCNIHPWMHGYLYVSDNPYAAVTDANGAFTFTNVPPGTYTITAWHEMLDKVKVSHVKVESGKTTRVRVEYQ